MAQRVARARASMDLKLSILSALNKLADRDTQQIGMDELLRTAENLQPEGIPVFLGCLYEISSEQKSVVRREGVKLVGILARLYGDLLTPHVQKIVAALVRRLKEPDSNIRDACVDAIGTLVAHVPAPAFLANAGGSGNAGTNSGAAAEQAAFSGPVGVFTKPLFDALNEQARNVQIGAAMSLSRALDNAPRDLPPACTQRLCVKLLKFLSSNNFNAKPALLPALGGLSRASGGGIIQHLGTIISALQEALQSSDWATRKAAADTFAAVALSVGGPPLTNFKTSTMALLDSYRFDKVKPTRDSVVDAIHIWKNVPDPPVVDASPTKTVSSKSTDSNGTVKIASNRKYLTADSRSSSPSISPAAEKLAAHVVADKGSVKKKTASSVIPERKTNLDFFRKLSIRNSDDWQIEVAVPRGSPPTSHNKENHEGPENVVVMSNGKVGGNDTVEEIKEKEKPVFSSRVDSGRLESATTTSATDVKSAKVEVATSNGSSMKYTMNLGNGWSSHHPQQAQTQHTQQIQQPQHSDIDSIANSEQQHKKAIAGADLVSIGRQLSQLEKGQSDLMEMLQEFMGNSQESTLTLESRVQRLERALEDMARITAASMGISRATAGGQNPNSFGDEHFSSSPSSNNNSRFSRFTEPGGHHRPSAEDNWSTDMFNRAPPPTGRGASRVENVELGFQDHPAKRWESRTGTPSVGFGARLGEGPSARSVWRASKNEEATLAAIRVAAGECDQTVAGTAGTTGTEKMNISSSTEASTAPSNGGIEPSSNVHGHGNTANCNNGDGGTGGGAWSIWGRVMESLQGGDLDSAYEEVICAGDELLMVRLMNRTGPVADQLSSETLSDLLRSISQFLQQPSFVDCALPWIRQVTELVRTNGPKSLGLSGSVKKELLSSLQEASLLDFPERWMANAVAKMAAQLGSIWMIELQA